MEVLSTDWFQLAAVPILLAVVSAVASALASRDRIPRLRHWLVGTDLCLEALAMNLALAVAAATAGSQGPPEPRVRLIETLAAALVLDLLVLMGVVYVLRFFGLNLLTFIGTTVSGVVMVWSTFLLWRAP